MPGMTMCRLTAMVLSATLLSAAAVVAQSSGPLTPSTAGDASAAVGAPAKPPAAAALPHVPRAVLKEWISRVARDSTVWAQCLRGSVSSARKIVVASVVEALGERMQGGSLRYGCPAGSIGSAHSFAPGVNETCMASDQERAAFFGGWEQVRVLVCPGPRILWLVRPAHSSPGDRVDVALAPPGEMVRAWGPRATPGGGRHKNAVRQIRSSRRPRTVSSGRSAVPHPNG